MATSLGVVVAEAPLERNDSGLYPAGEGWFVVNARDAQWFDSNGLGFYTPFEGENARFSQLGLNIAILRPGEPSCMYHAEGAQEDFLVLSGECLLIVEGQERHLKAWDFVHCPPMTRHVFVGAGDGPCLLLGAGARISGRALVYPVDDAALRHRAGVEKETSEGAEAYASYGRPWPAPCPPEFPGS
jgi:uncharacterized cupin superfamily protein